MPKISVILTSFNHEKFIREAIDSVLNQTFTDFELIIWDDASTDNSWAIINTYSDPRIKVFRNDETKRGVHGINISISEIASGEYIAIHHSDDIWEVDKLKKQVEFLEDHAGIGAVFTHVLAIDERGIPLDDVNHFYYNIFNQPNRTRYEWLNHFFFLGNALCHPSILIRKTCYEECGSYRTGMAQLTDFEMWIRLCLKYEIHVLPEKLIKFRVLDNEKNTSGSRPATKVRVMYEGYKISTHFRNINKYDELVKIFPSVEKFNRGEETDNDFALAMLFLEEKPLAFAPLFALDILFEIITDSNRASKIKRLYNFDYKDYIVLTGQHDVFSLELNEKTRAMETEHDLEIAELNQILIDRNDEINNLKKILSDKNSTVSELNNSLAAVYKSRSWKLTKPLRFSSRLYLNGKQKLRRVLSLVKTIAKSLREFGLLSTINKIKSKHILKGLFNRYSSVPKLSSSQSRFSFDTVGDETPSNRTLISMVKNEKSIIETFAAHVLAMFDRVIFVDHQSTDGTSEYLKSLAAKHPEVEYLLFNEAGYYQSEVMTWVVKNMVGSVYNGWVFFLDADEYLPFSSRTKFDEKLASYGSFPLISMPWLNLVPMDMEAGQVKSGVFLRPSRTATHHKIAFQPSLIPVDKYVIAQGNHALLIGDSYQQLFPAEEAFSIYHIPIRTKQQLRDKIQLGVESYKKMGVDRANNLGFHWDEISRLIDNKGLTDDLMADMVIRYGEQMVPPYGKSISSMIQDGHTEFTLDICTIEQIVRFNEVNLTHDVGSDIFALNDRQEKVGSRRNLPIVLDAERQVLKFKTD